MTISKNNKISDWEKLIVIIGFFAVFILGPYTIITNSTEREYYSKKGIIKIKGICIENDLRNKGRVIKYKFIFKNKIYFGDDHVIDNIKWNKKIEPNDSILIQVSSINPEFNYLD